MCTYIRKNDENQGNDFPTMKIQHKIMTIKTEVIS